MTDLTTGQRIAQCRKTLNLSQEGLGEKVGVSRQAISKWEADAALPDIDKLIALSRLFQVSVGWLLGVEELPQPQPEAPQLTEELLLKIEEVVKRYQPQKKPFPIGKKLLAVLAALLLIVTASAFRGELAETQAQVSYLSAQIRSSQQNYANIMHTLDNLDEQLDKLGKASANFSISGHSFRVEPDGESANALVTLSVVPDKLSGDYKVSLAVRREGKQVVSQACAWDGSGFTAQLLLPLENGYEYWLTAEYPSGAQEQVQLVDSTAENLKSSFTIRCDIAHGHSTFDPKNNTLTLDGYELHLVRPTLTSGYDVDWETVELLLYHTRGGSRQIVYTDDHFSHDDYEQSPPDQILEFWLYPKGPYPLPELEDGDGLELWISAEMSNGIRLMQMVDSWAYLDGELITGTPVAPLA